MRHPVHTLARFIVRLASLLTPWWMRREWRREWDAELHAGWLRSEERGEGWSGRLRLLRRSVVSIGDALTLSKGGWKMDGMGRDLRIAVRTLLRKPGFTLIAVATLGLGIGANTAVYSMVDGVLIEPLPYPDSDEIVSVLMTAPGLELPIWPLSQAEFVHFSEHQQVYDAFAVYGGATLNLTGGEQPERLRAYTATSDLFEVIGVPAARGRTFAAGDDEPGAAPVAVISDALWRGTFGADPDMVGRTIVLDDVSTTVVGVMPPGFDFPRPNADLWVPLIVDRADPNGDDFGLFGVGRLKDGMTLAAAENDLRRSIGLIGTTDPDRFDAAFIEQSQMGPLIETSKERLVGDIQQALWILLGVVGFVLLIACANVANLFIVRAEGRAREVAVRTSLGASPGDVVRYYLTEALVLAGFGGLLGLVVGRVAVSAVAATAPVALPRLGQVGLDGSVILFTVGISVFSAVLFGLFPAARYAAPSLTENLKEGARGATSSRSGTRARSALVVVQVALALVLLVGSGLMARSFWSLRAVDPGFEAEGLLVMDLAMPISSYPDDETLALFYEGLVQELGGLPGVTQAGIVSNIPLDGGRTGSDIGVEDFPLQDGELPRIVEQVIGSPGFHDALGLELVEGRWLTAADSDRAGNILINETFARRYWPQGGAIGKRLNTSSDLDRDWLTIVGVVADVHMNSLTEEPVDLIYLPLLNPVNAFDDPRSVSVLVRTELDPTSLTPQVQSAIWQRDAKLPVANPRAMSTVLADAMAGTSFTMVMLGVASLVALLLGALGIYGVIAYMVAQRTREIGVRIALGAPKATVLGLVARQGFVLAGLGLGIGLIGAIAMSSVLESLLVGVEARDVTTYVVVTLVLGLTAAIASIMPARKAVRVDPIEALRAE